jgi:hypothetical protein
MLVFSLANHGLATELLMNGDFSEDWQVGWAQVARDGAENPEVATIDGIARLRLAGSGQLYLWQRVDELPTLDVTFRVNFKPQSLEHLAGIGWAGLVYAGIGYLDSEGNVMGFTRFYALDCFCSDYLIGAQAEPKSNSTNHYVEVSSNSWTVQEVTLDQELRTHLPGIDSRSVQGVVVILGIGNSKDHSEGILEVDLVSLTGPDPDRVISISDSGHGSTVAASVDLNTTTGGENAIGFSLTFDPAVIQSPQITLGRDLAGATLNVNTSQAASGRLGVALGLPAGQYLLPGTYQIANIVFAVTPQAAAEFATIDFADQPIPREVADVRAESMSADWVSGSLGLNAGYEADVSPRPLSDNRCTVADWTQVGRFAAALDQATYGDEFQRADCAPRAMLGNGRITTADWVQAGRYVSALDPLTPAGGPAEYASGKLLAPATTAGTSVVRAVDLALQTGQEGVLTIQMEAQGTENALGFSLSYNPSVLRFIKVAPASGTVNAALQVNTTQSTTGQIGIALALSAGSSFQAGIHDIVYVSFMGTQHGTTNVSFGDDPIARELVDVMAAQVDATYLTGVITVTSETSVTETIGSTPNSYSLLPSFPNPFNGQTTITYLVPAPSMLRLDVYDANGSLIHRLAYGEHQPGIYTARWDGTDTASRSCASGVYLCRLSARGFTQVRKITLIR